MRKLFYQYLIKLFKENPQLAILIGDIGVFPLREAFQFDPNRIYNIGILEQATIGVAAGLSTCGYIPFVHSIAPFITERSFEQLKLLSLDKRNVFIVSIGNSYDYTVLGPTHHCPADLSIIGAIPNFMSFCPGNQDDVVKIITKYFHEPCPKYIRLSEYTNNMSVQFPNYQDLHVLKEGSGGVTIVIGTAFRNMEKLVKNSLDATILYSYNISEFNIKSLITYIKNCGIRRRITVVEPSYRTGIISKLALALDNIESINSISVPLKFIDKYGVKEEIDNYLEIDEESILKKLKAIYA